MGLALRFVFRSAKRIFEKLALGFGVQRQLVSILWGSQLFRPVLKVGFVVGCGYSVLSGRVIVEFVCGWFV